MSTQSILVVDDDETTLGLMVRFLGSLGCGVVSATNGIDALRMLNESTQEIGLVFLDIAMPQMSGLELAQTIREEIGSEVPMVALTARVGPDVEADAHAVGITSVISKPFEPKVLRDTLSQLGFLPR